MASYSRIAVVILVGWEKWTFFFGRGSDDIGVAVRRIDFRGTGVGSVVGVLVLCWLVAG